MDATLADPLVGQVLNERYRVESRIARGGMATVYVGWDLKLDRTVALKVMHPNLVADDDFVRRFIGEAKAAAALSHPNVVAVYDQGTDKGNVYLAMEYVPGRTLRDLLGQVGRLGPRAALEVIQPVLSALGAAHQAGMVHRDVKPENVLLTNDNRIKVVDFGLARAVAAGHQTKTGMIIGTVGYLAPEQVVSGIADSRSDVYAAGILLFELITGQQPHQGETPLTVAYKHVNERVPPPSSLIPGLPPALDTLMAAATNHDPNRRPTDANHFRAAVIDIYRGLPAGADAAAGVIAPQHPAHGFTPAPGPHPGGPHPPGGHPQAATAFHPAAGHQTQVVPRASAPFTLDRLQTLLGSRYLYVGLAAAVALVLGWALWYTAAGRYAEVPNLVGKTVADAEALGENAGFKVKVAPAVHDENVPRNRIIKTDPPAFKELERDAVVTLFPSKGPSPVAVPDVKGMPLPQAQQALTVNKLKFEVQKEFSLTVPRGNVVKTDPAAGAKQARDLPVKIFVSDGIRLPDMNGWQRADAENTLRGWGLNPVVEERDDQNPPGTVLEQDPKPGTGLARGDTVKLIVAKPPFGIPFPPFGGGDNIAQVPGVVGKPVRDARRELEQAGFKVDVRRSVGRPVVISQNPPGGAQVQKGSRVVIVR